VRRVPFSCFARPDSYSTVLSASNPVFMFSAPGLVFGRDEGVGSRFHVLRSRTHFRRCRVRPIPFSCAPLSDMFSAIPRASGPVFMSCAPRLIFDGTEGVGSNFHVLRSRTHFRRYRGRRFPFSFFQLPDSFSAVPSASGPVFMFCAPRLFFGCTECVGSRFHVLRTRTRSRFHVLRARTHFRRYRGRRVPFSNFARSDSFSAVPWASSPFFMFCAPGLVFGRAECVGSLCDTFSRAPHRLLWWWRWDAEEGHGDPS
jgi:hypothetical protein